MIFAQTTSQIGSWFQVAFLFINGAAVIGGLVAFFATRREVQEIDRRVIVAEKSLNDLRNKMENDKLSLIQNGEERSTRLHRRIDPLIENTAALKAGQEAFTESFRNFTAVLVAQGAQGRRQS